MDTFKPGSHEAVKHGCLCPRMDNAYGEGRGGDGKRYGWIYSAKCPLHVPVGCSTDCDLRGEYHDHDP